MLGSKYPLVSITSQTALRKKGKKNIEGGRQSKNQTLAAQHRTSDDIRKGYLDLLFHCS